MVPRWAIALPVAVIGLSALSARLAGEPSWQPVPAAPSFAEPHRSPMIAMAGVPQLAEADKAKGAEQAKSGEADKTEPAKRVRRSPSAANSFNRLLKRQSGAPNERPARDGIHDPTNAGTHSLQWPSEAFQDLPRSGDGNRVDWVKALNQGQILPWTELEDPNAEPFTMDLVIVREVKGSMPNVVFPHQQHTEWLDCTNCHDEIFVPEKGANPISMAAILLGQKCGVCHGTVAFPVTDCRRCHAQPKTPEQLKALAGKSAWRSGGKQTKPGDAKPKEPAK